MKIESVVWRNFASYGNKKHKISFKKDSGQFFLVVGANGSGKSSLSDIIQFALYGRVNNKRLPDLPNRFNNNLEVEITIWKNSFTKVRIERGVSPGYLRLFINDEEYDQAGKKNIDAYIEDEIIKMPFYVFNNIVSLSINDFKSFLNMSTHDKRMIIDKIFGLDIINNVRNLVRDKIKAIKNNIFLLDKEIDMIDSHIKSSSDEIEKLTIQTSRTNSLKGKVIDDRIKKIARSLTKIEERISDIEVKEADVNQNLNKLVQRRAKEKAKKQMYSKQHKLLLNDKCPTCTQSFHNETMQQMLSDIVEKEQKTDEFLTTVNESVDKLTESSKKILKAASEANRLNADFQFKLNALRTDKKTILDTKEIPKEIKYIGNAIERNRTKKEDKISQKDKDANLGNFFNIIDNMFGDKGIKQIALKKIIPSLNVEISKTLEDMHLEYRVIFDNEFIPTIRHLGYTVSQQQLSTGERKKIDFAILIALLRLIKIKNPGMNLFYLDEIFASLDADAVHHVLQVLSKTSKELGLNIFVINHTVLPTEVFDYKISINKENNFSNLEIQKIS